MRSRSSPAPRPARGLGNFLFIRPRLVIQGGYDPPVQIEVPRLRVALAPDGTLLRVVAVELLIDGERSTVLLEEPPAGAIWLPTGEVALRPRS